MLPLNTRVDRTEFTHTKHAVEAEQRRRLESTHKSMLPVVPVKVILEAGEVVSPFHLDSLPKGT